MDYPSERLYKNKIDLSSNRIYYFYSYRQWPDVKNLSEDDVRRIATERILDFKTEDKKFESAKIDAFKWFKKCIFNHLADLSDEKWIVCSIPSHDQVFMTRNNMDRFLEFCKLPNNFLVVVGLILRKYETQQKHTGNYGVREFRKDFDSYKVREDIDLKDKNIIIFDDVTTSGCSLVAARILLQNMGAKNVVCIALGRTVEKHAGQTINDMF